MTHYILTRKELVALLETKEKLRILNNYGLDNWSGYGEALVETEQEYNRDNEECQSYYSIDEIIEEFAELELSNYKTTTINE